MGWERNSEAVEAEDALKGSWSASLPQKLKHRYVLFALSLFLQFLNRLPAFQNQETGFQTSLEKEDKA